MQHGPQTIGGSPGTWGCLLRLCFLLTFLFIFLSSYVGCPHSTLHTTCRSCITQWSAKFFWDKSHKFRSAVDALASKHMYYVRKHASDSNKFAKYFAVLTHFASSPNQPTLTRPEATQLTLFAVLARADFVLTLNCINFNYFESTKLKHKNKHKGTQTPVSFACA